MDYYTLLDIAMEIGYRLAISGAETFRVEESISRIADAYGIKAEVFAIPNCLHISLEDDNGLPLTRMRRIGIHGNDLDSVEQFSNLSRRICQKHPEPSVAMQWLKETERACRHYSLPVHLLGNILGSCGFAVIFGGTFIDCLWAGVCGLTVGLVRYFTEHLKTNQFFKIIAASFFMALIAYLSGATGLTTNADTVIIGTLMILVPGFIFTNALRDIIYGDTNSGINRIVQMLLVAAAIALGTGAAWNLVDEFIKIPIAEAVQSHPLPIEAIACFIGCTGFFIIFNIHGHGAFLCALGGTLTWICYRTIRHFGVGDIAAYFFATMFAALYSESMARIRKYPAISYLVISLFPLIPGAGIYYTTNHLVRNDMTRFTEQGFHTIAIAGSIAVGILLISSIFRVVSIYAHQKRNHS